MHITRKHLMRLGIIATLVSVMVPAIASAQPGAPAQRVTFPVLYRFTLDDHVVNATTENRLTQFHTTKYDQMVARLTRLLHRRHLARLRRLAARRRLAALRAQQATSFHTYAASSAAPAPVSYSGGGVDWYGVARCESGDNWSINTGNGYWGGLQFAPSTWFANGGGPFSGYGPFPYSAAQQIAVAERVLATQGPHAWPVCFAYG